MRQGIKHIVVICIGPQCGAASKQHKDVHGNQLKYGMGIANASFSLHQFFLQPLTQMWVMVRDIFYTVISGLHLNKGIVSLGSSWLLKLKYFHRSCGIRRNKCNPIHWLLSLSGRVWNISTQNTVNVLQWVGMFFMPLCCPQLQLKTRCFPIVDPSKSLFS